MAFSENVVLNSSFWHEIDKLTATLRQQSDKTDITEAPDVNKTASATNLEPFSRLHVMSKIENIIEDLFLSVSQNESPTIKFKNRNKWENVNFDVLIGVKINQNASLTEIKLNCSASIRKFAVMMKILNIAYNLLKENSYSTKRDIYYNDVLFFGQQTVVDNVVDDISCFLQVPRSALNIMASSKGYVVGPLIFREKNGDFIDCNTNTMGRLISSNVSEIEEISSNAKLILVVEKDATYQKLLDDNILTKLYPIIMITGKGYPDINTRLMVRKLYDTLRIPVFALVDADPHGIEIMCVYRFGSRSLSFEAEKLAIPALRWIGILPTDLQKLDIGKEGKIPLTNLDRRKIELLTERPFMKDFPLIKHELQIMLENNFKSEIQSLAMISTTFLVDVYIQTKVKHGKWV